MPARIADDVRDAIAVELRANVDGSKSFAQIAREHGVSGQFVGDIARELGIAPSEVNRAQAENATKARLADMAARRSRIAERLIEEAERLLDSLHQPHTAFNFGGKDNTYSEREMPEPDVKSRQTIMTTAAIALDKHIALVRHDSGAEIGETVGLLGALLTGLREVHGDGNGHREGSADVDRSDVPG